MLTAPWRLSVFHNHHFEAVKIGLRLATWSKIVYTWQSHVHWISFQYFPLHCPAPLVPLGCLTPKSASGERLLIPTSSEPRVSHTPWMCNGSLKCCFPRVSGSCLHDDGGGGGLGSWKLLFVSACVILLWDHGLSHGHWLLISSFLEQQDRLKQCFLTPGQ